MGKKVFDEKTSLWKNFLSLIIFMRNEIRRAIYSTDYIKTISIYFLSSSIGIMRQIYNDIQIEECKCFRHTTLGFPSSDILYSRRNRRISIISVFDIYNLNRQNKNEIIMFILILLVTPHV